MSVGDVWDRAEKRQEQHEADLRAHIVKLDAELKRLHSRRGWCSVCEERHEVGDCPVLPDSPYHRAEQAEAERDQANTSAIAQRRSFEKALEGRDEIIAELEAKLADTERRFAAIVVANAKLLGRIAELEGENERLRRVIGAAVEDGANLEAGRDRAHDDAGNLEGEVNGLKAERDALRCCGSCCLWRPEPDADDAYVCKSLGVTFGSPLPGDPCHFTPSRWQPREGGDAV